MSEHKKQQEFLRGKLEAGQLSHAYLFSGQEGIGKEKFTREFIKLINCLYYKTDGREICSINKKGGVECQNCKLIEKGGFPDLLIVDSLNSTSSVKNEKDMMEIDVAQIREVNTFLSYKAYYGNYKAVVIQNADKMNTEAQNSFLKTLEEPKGKTVIFLLSSKPDALLPTIFSRCQTITFFPLQKYEASPTEQKALQELLPIINGELAAKFQFTKKVNLEGDNFGIILKVLQRYFRNVMLAKMGVISQPIAPQFVNYSVDKIKHILQTIETLHKQVSMTNASPKLALEILLLELL